jgi:hypothetical protein
VTVPIHHVHLDSAYCVQLGWIGTNPKLMAERRFVMAERIILRTDRAAGGYPARHCRDKREAFAQREQKGAAIVNPKRKATRGSA